MKPVFEILPEPIFYEQTDLICEISPNSFSFLFANDSTKRIHGLTVLNFPEEELYETLKSAFAKEKFLQKNYKKVFFSIAFEESLLIPERFLNMSHEDLLNNFCGDLNEGLILTDLIAEKNLYNIYRIPETIHHMIVERFPVAAFNHQYSNLIKRFSGSEKLLNIIFYQHRFTVIVFNNGLQLVQSFNYENAKDVVYHLLNITNQFGIKDIPVSLEGAVDFRSGLVNAINSYFSNVSLAGSWTDIEIAEKIKEHPVHHFTHLFSLVACV